MGSPNRRLGRVRSRRGFLMAAVVVVTAPLAAVVSACGGDSGTRENPFPYADPRSRNTRL
ncbi:MAG: hypothetical protein FJ029_01835 [Actinobacteria bacterium]|nr:hypothetical protein [Actinomycetota bacterium]